MVIVLGPAPEAEERFYLGVWAPSKRKIKKISGGTPGYEGKQNPSAGLGKER